MAAKGPLKCVRMYFGPFRESLFMVAMRAIFCVCECLEPIALIGLSGESS